MRRVLFVSAVLAATMFAVLAVVGVAVWVYLAPQLPSTDSLRDVSLQVPLRVYDRGGRMIAEFGELRRRPVRLADIPETLRVAVVATEDEHFHRHPGVDWRGIARALVHLVRTREKGPGGSTITMQVARNFFLVLGREKTYFRKLNEILLALSIERELSKDEILELYLNKIFLGHRAYGVAAAAEVYYGRALDELDLAQMAMIAGLPQRPSALNPIVNPERARARRNHVLRRLLEVGHIDATAARAASETPITASLHTPAVETRAPYVAEMVRREAERTLGSSTYTGAYHAHTTINSRLQAAAVRALREALLEYDRRHGYRGPEGRYEIGTSPDPARLEERLRDVRPVGGLPPALVTGSVSGRLRYTSVAKEKWCSRGRGSSGLGPSCTSTAADPLPRRRRTCSRRATSSACTRARTAGGSPRSRRSRAPWSHWIPRTGRFSRWPAGSISTAASSTAGPKPAASRAPASSPSSTLRPRAGLHLREPRQRRSGGVRRPCAGQGVAARELQRQVLRADPAA